MPFKTMIVPHGHVLFMSQPMVEIDGQNVFDAGRRIIGVANRNTPCSLVGIAIGPAKDFDNMNPNFAFPKMGMGGVLGNDVYIRIPSSWTTYDYPGVRYMENTNMVKGNQMLGENIYAVAPDDTLTNIDDTNRGLAATILQEQSNKLAYQIEKAQRTQQLYLQVIETTGRTPTPEESAFQQDSADTYASAVVLKQFMDEALIGVRGVAFTSKGDLVFEQLSKDVVQPVITSTAPTGVVPTGFSPTDPDLPGRPVLEAVSQSATAPVPSGGGVAGFIGANIGALVRGVRTAAGAATKLTPESAKTFRTAARTGAAVALGYLGYDIIQKGNKSADEARRACQDCLQKNPNNPAACNTLCDLAKKVLEDNKSTNPLKQAAESVSSIAGSITTLALVGVGAYALFLIMGMVSKAAPAEKKA